MDQYYLIEEWNGIDVRFQSRYVGIISMVLLGFFYSNSVISIIIDQDHPGWKRGRGCLAQLITTTQ